MLPHKGNLNEFMNGVINKVPAQYNIYEDDSITMNTQDMCSLVKGKRDVNNPQKILKMQFKVISQY